MRRVIGIITACLVAVGGAVAVSSPAQADPSGCGSTNFCFHDTSVSIPLTQAGADTPRNTCISLAPAFQNRATFITNHTGVQWFVFHTHGCTGSHFTSFAFTNQDLTTVPAWNNSINSYYRTALR